MVRIYIILVSIITLSLTSGCTTKPIHIHDEQRFSLMAYRLTAILQDRGFIDNNRHYTEILLPYTNLPSNVGEYLFQHISPNVQDNVSSKNSITFAQAQTEEHNVTIEQNGFIFQQGPTVTTVKLLAQGDWYNHDKQDWFVIYQQKSLYNHSSISYYLIVSPCETSSSIEQKTLAICDDTNNTCTVLINLIKNTNVNTSFFEVDPGIYSIIRPSETTTAITNQEPQIVEQKLQQ